MKKIFYLTLLLISIENANSQSFNRDLAEKLQTTLDSLVGMFANTKGMSASVYYPEQGVWQGTSGLSHAGTSITPEMLFGIASNTKLFTATVLLKLSEGNLLTLDDSLHEWLPFFSNVNPNITIRQLLNHTSGISDPFVSPGLIDSIQAAHGRIYTPEEVLGSVGPPLFNPGEGYGYSNINYILAGMVAEQATGYHISRLIRDSLLAPLQMNNTFYDVEEGPTGTIAHRWYNGIDYHDTSRVSLNTSGGPAGSLFSTSGEMARWYQALMSGQILDSASLHEMTTFATPGKYGLGIGSFDFFGNACWGHGGSTHGYRSRMIYDPDMKAVVCGLSNSNPSAVDGITALLYKVLVDYVPAGAPAITGDEDVCQGQTSVMYSIPAIERATTYVWTLPDGAAGSSSTNSITVHFGDSAVSGNITVQGSNTYGKGSISSFSVTVHSKPPTPFITQSGSQLQSDAFAGNQWYNSDGPIPGATDQEYIVSTNGTYYVIVTESECTSNVSNSIHVLVNDVYSLDKQKSITMYPNPAQDGFTIELPENTWRSTVEIFNVLGQTVYREDVTGTSLYVKGQLRPGLYLLNIHNGTSIDYRSIIVK